MNKPPLASGRDATAKTRDLVAETRMFLRGQDVGDRSSEHLLAREAEGGAASGIHIQIMPVRVGDEDAVHGIVHEQPQPCLRRAKLFLECETVGDS